MSRENETIDTELDRRIDLWLASRGKGGEVTMPSAGDELSTADVAEMDELAALFGVVEEHGFGNGSVAESDLVNGDGDLAVPELHWSGGAAEPMRSHGNQSWLLRAAAAVILVAGLGAGVGIAVSSRSRDIGSAHAGPAIPGPLLKELATTAGYAADPYPSHPIDWVETTVSRLGPVAARALLGPKWRSESHQFYVGQLQGNFLTDLPDRSDLIHSFSAAYEPPKMTPIMVWGGPPFALAKWGTVHTYWLRPPVGPSPAAPPPLVQGNLRLNLGRGSAAYPTKPALWVQTTLGGLEATTGLDSKAIPLPAGSPRTKEWVVDSQQASWWLIVNQDGRVEGFQGPGSWMARFSTPATLGRLGTVHEYWFGPALPTKLPSLVTARVSRLLTTQGHVAPILETHGIGKVSADWVVMSVGAFEEAVRPQVNAWLDGIPLNTPIWVIEVFRPVTGPDWELVTTANGNSRTVVSSDGFGLPNLLGITKISQLAPPAVRSGPFGDVGSRVHHVMFVRSANGSGYTAGS